MRRVAGVLRCAAAEMSRAAADYAWTPPRDFRVICTCQRHATRRRVLHRAKTAGRGVAGFVHRRAMTLLVGLPIALGVASIPIDAMNSEVRFSVFATRKARAVLAPAIPAAPPLTLEMAKETLFRTEVPYGPIILAEARRNDLQPELVAAVVEAESDFRPRLVSNKQARGLMQIVPETSRILGCSDPFDPRENIAAGTKYLRYLLDRFGDERLALAAYNSGEGRVERLGGVPPIVETRDYLERVARHTRAYRQRVRNRYVAASRMGVTIAAE
jgi:soluble lytic murein transglycosylase-like protein